MAEPQSLEQAPSYFGPRLSLLFSFQFLYIGLFLPFFPVWLKSKGLDPTQISLVLATALITRVFTSGQITSFADRQADRATIVSGCYVLSALSIFLFVPTQSFLSVFIVAMIFNFFFNPILPILDAITLSGVRRFSADYGKIRIWGSFVFILANIVGGVLLSGYEADFLLYTMIAAAVLGAAFSFCLPRIGRRKAGVAPSSLFSAAKLWREPKFLAVLMAAGLVHASHALIYGFGSIHWQSAGYSGLIIGVFWAIGVVAEMFVFQFSKSLFARFTPVSLILIGAIGALARWTVFPFVDSEFLFLTIQILHGLSFGVVHIATMHYIMEAVPEENLGKAQGVFFVLSGATMGIFVLSAGPIYSSLGVDGFYVMAGLALLAIIFLAISTRFNPTIVEKAG